MSKNSAKILASAILLSLSLGVFLPSFGSALPLPDPYEPNDYSGDAALISEGTYDGLTLNTSDISDWYVVNVPARMAISVEIEITSSIDGDFFIVYLEDYENNMYFSDGFYYFTAPKEDDDVIGNVAFYCDVSSDVYINVHSYGLDETTYTMTINVFDPKGNPKFDYGISEGENLVYTLINNVDLVASDAFYNEIQDFTNDELGDEFYYIAAPDFSLQDFVGDMEDFISTSVDLQFSISDIYNFDMGEEYSTDIIEGDLRMGNDGTWELPSDYVVSKIEEFKTVIEPHMNSTTYTDDVEPEIDLVIDEVETATIADFNDLPLSGHNWFENVSEFLEFDELDISNETSFPMYPFEHYIPLGGTILRIEGMMMENTMFSALSSVSLCYPTDFNFQDLYQFGVEIYDYLGFLNQETGDYFPILSSTIDELIDIGGISTFQVSAQAIAISWASMGIDFTTLETLLEYSGDSEWELENELAYYAIDYDNSAAAISLALEYDENMVLASIAYYVDLEISIDATELPVGLDLGGEVVSLSFSQALVKEGIEPPTEEQIKDGEVGEDRIFEDNPSDDASDDNSDAEFDFSNIPGYSGLVVAIVSVVSSIMLISRKNRKN